MYADHYDDDTQDLAPYRAKHEENQRSEEED